VPHQNPIHISLVIPVRDEEASLPALLESIASQSRQPDEIVIVDGGSKDRTVEMLREAALRDRRIRIVETDHATPGKGRNLGIAAASNEWIALTDAGIRLEREWLERLAATAASDPSLSVVYGNFEPVVNTFFERCASLTYPAVKTLRNGQMMRGPFVASMLLRRDVWKAIGGFPDLRAAEDLIFMERVRELKCGVGWEPHATVWWQLQPDIRRTYRKFVLYSAHNVWAGREWDWHYPVLRTYSIALVLLLLSIFHSRWWLFPLASLGAIRVFRSIWRRRDGRDILWLLNPVQFAGVAFVQAVVDVATFVGWGKALANRPRGG
jgi:glycosyltransferase involved in cell wall biosynthesis